MNREALSRLITIWNAEKTRKLVHKSPDPDASDNYQRGHSQHENQRTRQYAVSRSHVSDNRY